MKALTLTAAQAQRDQARRPSAPSPEPGRWAHARRAASELTPDAIEQIAQRVAQLLQSQAEPRPESPEPPVDSMTAAGLLNAAQLAKHLGTTRAWVYEHALELGAIKLGTGPRARMRFDLATASQALKYRDPLGQAPASQAPPKRGPGRPRRHAPGAVQLLPVYERRHARGIVARLRAPGRTGW